MCYCYFICHWDVLEHATCNKTNNYITEIYIQLMIDDTRSIEF